MFLRRCFAASGGIFACVTGNDEGGGILLASSGWDGILLNILQCTGHRAKTYLVQNVNHAKAEKPSCKLKNKQIRSLPLSKHIINTPTNKCIKVIKSALTKRTRISRANGSHKKEQDPTEDGYSNFC